VPGLDARTYLLCVLLGSGCSMPYLGISCSTKEQRRHADASTRARVTWKDVLHIGLFDFMHLEESR
jgi:hypothetical protein